MCGIVGYIGRKSASGILLKGLKRLEYRGYDSAGLITAIDGIMHLRRAVGRVQELELLLANSPAPGEMGISHTRWATHGRPTEANAHPHLDSTGRIAIVHNGIIENHATIRALLTEKGIVFRSETDTEALAQLCGYFYAESGDFLESVRLALQEVRGTFGICAICVDEPRTMIAAKRGSPLLLGLGDNEFLVSSDGGAIVEHTNQVIYLNDNELAIIDGQGFRLMTIDSLPVEKKVATLELKLEEIELGTFAHYMLKEIHEQPAALRNCLAGRLDVSNARVTLGALSGMGRELGRIKRVLLTGCGTAWHACLVGEYLFEELARLPTNVEYASELRYRNPIVEEGTLGIVVSQSGETADTLAALHEIRLKGATVFGVVNVVGSTIARETDAGVYLHAGPEIGVASTKAFTAQVAVLAMLAADLGRRGHLSPERTAEFLAALQRIPDQVAIALGTESQAKAIAERLAHRDNWLYLGRGVNYPVALEGALKLKEISYIHAEGMPAAEMKHGPIALIEAGMPVVVVAPRDHTYEKVVANVEEVRGRRGLVIAVVSEGDTVLRDLADEVIVVPETLPLLSPLLTTIPLQFIAYYAALARGMNVDKPRNLAKSVTVE